MKKLIITLAALLLVPTMTFADTRQDEIASIKAQLIVLYSELIQLLQAQHTVSTPVVSGDSSVSTDTSSGSSDIITSTPLSIQTQMQSDPFYYNIQFQGDDIALSATTPIDITSFALGGVSASSSSQWSPQTGNNLCQNFNAGGQNFQGCTNANTLYVYHFTYDTPDNTLPVTFMTIDGRTQDVGLQSR